MSSPRRRCSPVRSWLMHGLRMGVLAVIFLLMHWQHQRFLSAQRAAGLDSVPITVIQSLFPDASKLGEPDGRGGRLVQSSTETLGAVLQTSPEGDAWLGFSGPTNMLVGMDASNKIVGLAIISSRDTRDHVNLIRNDPKFLSSLNRKDITEAASTKVDAVSGATLTSLAILQGIQARLGRVSGSLKFPEDYTLDEAKRLFPNAAQLSRDQLSSELWLVSDKEGNSLGWLLSNSPAADNLVGYQGPSRAILGANLNGEITGLIVDRSFDNEPYVTYVRDDTWFPKKFVGRTIEDLGKSRFEESGIEGVSGATMTSQTIAEGLFLAAHKLSELRDRQTQEQLQSNAMQWKVASTLLLLVIGMIIGLTPLRGRPVLRPVYQVALIVVMGFINGDLLSMAMFVGWAQSGIPLQNAIGLVCLTAAAVLIPVFARTNIYCDHLCPHGALQQLLPRHWKLKSRPRLLIQGLTTIRPVLLAIVVLVPLLHWPLSLVDLEPFDAYAWRAAGTATVTVAIVGLLASLFLPMGYCQFGCPTGALLGYLRRHARSGEFLKGDIIALSLLLIALLCFSIPTA